MVIPLIQQLVLSAFPHGGQGQARRNAWAGMVGEASIARNRREADAAVAVAQDRHERGRRAL